MKLNVPDMSCGHCASAITKALTALDAAAQIAFDMHQHQVDVATSQSEAAVMAALAQAGFPATRAA